MFTGLIQTMGRVQSIEPRTGGGPWGGGVRLLVDPLGWSHRPGQGESISISGCCLTVAEPPDERGVFPFDVIEESLEKTILGDLAPGDFVNLEHAARADTLLGGHIVQGHVDGVGSVTGVQTGDDYRIRIQPPPELMPYITPKGSVCVDGVSLTIAAQDPVDGWFDVALIPTTLELTTLGRTKTGDRVNLEADTLAKTIVHWLRNYAEQGLMHTPPRT